MHESHAMRPLGNLDDDVVSGDGGKSLPNSLGLTQSVRDASQDGAARHVVGLAVVNGDHGSRNGRVQGTAEGMEELWRFGGEERTQAACWSRETIVVDGDEVERVRGAEQVGPVARDAARGADLAQPPPLEREPPDDAAFRNGPRCLPTHRDASQQAL